VGFVWGGAGGGGRGVVMVFIISFV
jgi:hypothetical protein